MSHFNNNRISRQSYQNQYYQSDDQEDVQNIEEQQDHDYNYQNQNEQEDDHYTKYSFQDRQTNQDNYQFNRDHQQQNNEEEDDREYMRYNNYDMFVIQNNQPIQNKYPLQQIKQQQIKAIPTDNVNMNYRKNQTKSKSPSISHLPDFLRNQNHERNSSYNNKRENENQQQMKQNRQNERCQQLYELGEKKRIELIQKKRESEQLKENDSQCTFRPLSYTKNSIYRAQAQSSLNIFERTNIWNEQKKQKLDQIKQTDKNKDLEGCTFQPQIKSSQQSHLVNMSIYPSQNGIGLKGVDKFLRRQILARRAKEELEAQKENPFCHVENKNTNRNLEQIPITTLSKKVRQMENNIPNVDNQNYDQAIRNLRQELLNLQL